MSFGSQIFLADDEYTTMVKILPFMLKFTIQCIEYNSSNCNREIIVFERSIGNVSGERHCYKEVVVVSEENAAGRDRDMLYLHQSR